MIPAGSVVFRVASLIVFPVGYSEGWFVKCMFWNGSEVKISRSASSTRGEDALRHRSGQYHVNNPAHAP